MSIVCWIVKLIKDICLGVCEGLLFIFGHIILVLSVYMISVYSGYDWIWYYFRRIYGIWCLYYAFINPIYNILNYKLYSKNK